MIKSIDQSIKLKNPYPHSCSLSQRHC